MEVLCYPFGETRVRETSEPGGAHALPTPTHTYSHLRTLVALAPPPGSFSARPQFLFFHFPRYPWISQTIHIYPSINNRYPLIIQKYSWNIYGYPWIIHGYPWVIHGYPWWISKHHQWKYIHSIYLSNSVHTMQYEVRTQVLSSSKCSVGSITCLWPRMSSAKRISLSGTSSRKDNPWLTAFVGLLGWQEISMDTHGCLCILEIHAYPLISLDAL